MDMSVLQMATGAPPNAELHPMRALFLIPKDPPPRLEGDFSPDFQRFVERCLRKVQSRCSCKHGACSIAYALLYHGGNVMWRSCVSHAAGQCSSNF